MNFQNQIHQFESVQATVVPTTGSKYVINQTALDHNN